MSQVQLKQIISNLCHILECFNFSQITPEDFRQAKFNKPEVSQKLWRLLFELIFYLENSKRSDFKCLSSDLVASFFGRENPENVIKYVKIKLIELSYPNEAFYKLDDESLTSENSSRELLVAVAWLISTYQIMKIFVRNSMCFNQEEHFVDNAMKNNNLSQIREDIQKSREEYDSKDEENFLDRLNYLKWLQGVIKFKMNSFYASQLEKAKLTHRAHTITKSANSSHFSCSEIYLLKHPNLIERYEKTLAKNNELKSNLLNWLRNEDFFWKWMESVLDERSATTIQTDSETVIGDERIGPKFEFDNLIAKTIKEKLKIANESQRKFDESLQRLERLEKVVKEKALGFLSRGEIDQFAEANLVKFKSYESGVNSRFESILNSPYLADIDDPRSMDYLNLELVDSLGRLKMLPSGGKKSSSSSSSSSKTDAEDYSIKKRTDMLKQERAILERLYQEDKKRTWDKCQILSSKFADDCYVVYN